MLLVPGKTLSPTLIHREAASLRSGNLPSFCRIPFLFRSTCAVYFYRMSDLTRRLNASEGDDPRDAELLIPLVYNELRQFVQRQLLFPIHRQL